MTLDQSTQGLGNTDNAESKPENVKTYDTKVKVVGIYDVLEAVQKKSGQSGKASNGSVVHAAAFLAVQGKKPLDF